MMVVPSFSLKLTWPKLSSSFIELILIIFYKFITQKIIPKQESTLNWFYTKSNLMEKQKAKQTLCKLIKIMDTDQVRMTLIDPEKIDQQFRKQQQIKEKVEQLKNDVYKKFTIKKSKSVIHPSHITNVSSVPRLKPSSFEQTAKPQNKPNITNINFGQQVEKKLSSLHQVQSLKHLPAFSLSKGQFLPRKTIFQVETQRREINPYPQAKIKRTLSQKVKEMHRRDSQTILRKNSLFLVNCLKTRYRQTDKKVHIGDTNNVGNMRLGFFSEKSQGATHYQQRFQYMEEARQRLLMARNEGGSRLTKISPLHPEPW